SAPPPPSHPPRPPARRRPPRRSRCCPASPTPIPAPRGGPRPGAAARPRRAPRRRRFRPRPPARSPGARPPAPPPAPRPPPGGGPGVVLPEGFPAAPPARLALAVFPSDGCRMCQALGPAVAALRRDPLLAVETFDEHEDAAVWRALAIPGSPYALVLALDGTV